MQQSNGSRKQVVMDQNTVTAFPEVARGHGGRNHKTICVAPGCSGGPGHYIGRMGNLKAWAQETGLSVPKNFQN